MADRLQAQHRKKKRVRLHDNSPFPVPIGTISAETANKIYWYYFTGDLHGNHVTVSHSGDIALLYKMGFFGRGLFSRGAPSLYKLLPKVHVPAADSQEPERLKVMRRRMYLRHRHWTQQSRLDGADEQMKTDDNSIAADYAEFDSDVEYPPDEYHYDAMNKVMDFAESDSKHKSCDQIESSDWFSQASDNQSGGFHNESTEQSQLFSSESNALQRKNTNAIENATWGETDTDFWTSNDVASSGMANSSSETSWNVGSESKPVNEDAWDTMEADADFWGVDTPKELDNFSSGKAGKTDADFSGVVTPKETDNAKSHETIKSDENLWGVVKPKETDNVNSGKDGKDISKETLDNTNEIQSNTPSHSRVRKKNSDVDTSSPSKRIKLASNIGTSEVTVMPGASACDAQPASDSGQPASDSGQPASNTVTNNSNSMDSDNVVDESSTSRISRDIKYSGAVGSVDIEKPEGLNEEVSSSGTLHGEKCVSYDQSCSIRFENSSEICTHTKVDSNSTQNNGVDETFSEFKDTKDDTVRTQNIKINLSVSDCKAKDDTDRTQNNRLHTSVSDCKADPDNDVDETVVGELQEKTDPCCREEDEDGDYLVVDDSDCDDRVVGSQRKPRSAWKPVRKKEMYPVDEPLVLSSEEAFFLSYGLGCLTVRDETQSPCTLTDLWNRFRATPRFLPCYVAYHYFRSKGWVPKTGVVFGVDFIVYKVGPAFYHASYSVIVKTVEEGSLTDLDEYTDRKLTWRALAGLNRITEQVAKTLMFCYVIVPKDLTADDKMSPKCLSRFKVQLQIVNRWISAQERDKDKETDRL